MADKQRYEAPELTDFGTVADVTKGNIVANLNDLPLGSPVVQPTPPGGGGGGGSEAIGG